MNAQEIQTKIAEMLINTHSEEVQTDSEIEECKDSIIDLSRKIARYAEKEDWIKVDIYIRKVNYYTNKAISRELEIRRETLDDRFIIPKANN